jgi:general secretion pathway protein F
MQYFEATILQKGKKEKFGIYALNIKEANTYARSKYSGIIIKVEKSTQPLELQFKNFTTNLLIKIKRKKLKTDVLIASIRQLAVMTNAGIPIHTSLKEIAISTTDSNLKFVFTNLCDDLDSGHSLSKAMKNFSFELGNLTIEMVKLGEKTGNLDESLYSLANMLEEIHLNIVKFKKAMAYPRNVIISMIIAFTILISYVVPKFKALFESFHTQLPMPTKILLELDYIFTNYGLLVFTTLTTAFIILQYIIDNNKNVKYEWHKLLLKIYLVKNIILYATLSRFTLVFAELIRAGIPIAEALDTASQMIDNLVLRKKLSSVRISVEKGSSLNQGFKDTKLFENMIIQMLKAGEDSGKLDSMISKVASYFKMKFDTIIDNISLSIEPIILIIIASMVTLLALGIFMPMWEISSAVNAH